MLQLSAMREAFVNTLRSVEAALTPRIRIIQYGDNTFRLVQSLWWDDAHQGAFDAEILPYFVELGGRTSYRTVLDVGAATGMFSIAACAACPRLRHLIAFEPSFRQRILLRRNLKLNRCTAKAHIVTAGLWSSTCTLPFRTHGALSSVESASSVPSTYPFSEKITAVTLDSWISKNLVDTVDLIKMDVEGAEVEALQGARQTLATSTPELLIQAYHVRNGKRTFEECAELLRDIGYTCREALHSPGLLHAIHRASDLA